MTQGSNSMGHPQMPNLLRFGAIFRAFPFSTHPPFLPSLISARPLPFPKEVNKKFSYCGQNVLSVTKTHERNNDNKQILHLSVR